MRLLKNKILGILLISLLFKPLWLFNNQNLGQPADDMYHWIHAATIAYDKDIDYTEDYQIDNGTFNNITNVPSAPPGAGSPASGTRSGRPGRSPPRRPPSGPARCAPPGAGRGSRGRTASDCIVHSP